MIAPKHPMDPARGPAIEDFVVIRLGTLASNWAIISRRWCHSAQTVHEKKTAITLDPTTKMGFIFSSEPTSGRYVNSRNTDSARKYNYQKQSWSFILACCHG